MVQSVKIGDLPTTTEVSDSDSLVISSSSDGVTRQITKSNLFSELTEDVGDILENGTRSIVPALDSSYDLGSTSLGWRNVYANSFIGDGSQLTNVGVDRVNVKNFGAVGNGETDDTTSIQNAINYAAENGKSVYIPAGHYLVTTLYDHYDSDNNPNFPNSTHQNGRVHLLGEKPVSISQLFAWQGGADKSILKGTLLQTTSTTGPLFKMGNGLGVSDVLNTRETVVKDLTMSSGDSTSCSDTLILMDDINDGAEFDNLVLRNYPNASAGNVIRLDGRSYFNKFRNIRSSGGSVAFDLNQTEADIWEHLDISGARETGILIRNATNSTFSHSQITGASNGLELGLSQNVKLDHCWFENQDGSYDVKIHRRAQNVLIDGCLFASTDVDTTHLMLGGSSGNYDSDHCDNIRVTNTSFNFVGDRTTNTNYHGAIFKQGGCKTLSVENSSFRYIFGYGITVDTQDSVGPTFLSNIDWYPEANADDQFASLSQRVVGWDGSSYRSGGYLARGSGVSQSIDSDLNMSSWGHLPDSLKVNTSSGDITVTLPDPDNIRQVMGETILIRKTSASNDLIVSATFADSTIVTESRSFSTKQTYMFRYTDDGFIDISQ